MPPKRKSTKKGGGAATKKGKTTRATAAPSEKAAASTRSQELPTEPRRRQPSRKAEASVAAVRDEPAGTDAEDDLAPPAPVDDEGRDPLKRATRRATIKRKRDVTSDSEDDNEGRQAKSTRARPKKTTKARISPVIPDEEHKAEEDLVNWPNVEVLAEVESNVASTFDHNEVTLRISSQVHKDPTKFASRLGYRAGLTLIQSNQDEEDDEGTATLVGYIHTWRIDKPTATYPNVVKDNWLRELVRGAVKKTAPIRETSLCMRALYTEKGNVRAELADRTADHTAELQRSLIFVQMIYILPEFQGTRLVDSALAGYNEALSTLPEWYAFSGTLVLVPARPEGERGDGWGDETDANVEDRLIRTYERSGYKVWVRDVRVRASTGKDSALTIMGRTIPAPDAAGTAEEV